MDDFVKWCLDNAPEALKGLPKDELVHHMSNVYLSQVINNHNVLRVYHGTGDVDFKLNPGYHNPNNDYGCGLYTTPNFELAREWAMSKYNNGKTGRVIEFYLDTTDLNILNLTKVNPLVWLAVLTHNRPVIDGYSNNISNEILHQKYYIDTEQYDAVIGFRADDSYYTYVRDFMNNAISLETVGKALALGKLGKQICIKSEKAFNALSAKYIYTCTKEDAERFTKRDKLARENYVRLRKQCDFSGTFIRDICK